MEKITQDQEVKFLTLETKLEAVMEKICRLAKINQSLVLRINFLEQALRETLEGAS